MNVSAAEALCSFFFYGLSVSTNVAHHDNKICKELHLMTAMFKYRDSALSVFPSFGTKLTFDNILTYKPSFDFSYLLDLSCVGIDSMLKFSEILKICFLLKLSQAAESFHELSMLFINVIVYSAISHYQNLVTNLNLDQTHRYICYYKGLKVLSSYEFINWIFNSSYVDHAGHLGLHWIKNCILDLLESASSSWKENLPKQFDNYLREKNTQLIFPCSRQQKCFIVTYVNWIGRSVRLVRELCLLRFKYDQISEEVIKALSSVLRKTDIGWLEKCSWEKLIFELFIVSTLQKDVKTVKQRLRELITQT